MNYNIFIKNDIIEALIRVGVRHNDVWSYATIRTGFDPNKMWFAKSYIYGRVKNHIMRKHEDLGATDDYIKFVWKKYFKYIQKRIDDKLASGVGRTSKKAHHPVVPSRPR